MSFWDKQRVLVTGGGGFIGSHLAERLVAEGAQVRAFVRYNSRGDVGLLSLSSPDILNSIEVIAGDLRDLTAVKAAVDEIDIVFHLGALIAIPYSYLHPAEVIETNVLGTMNILLAARDAGTKRVVHTSTSEVYGTALCVPIDETHPLQGQSPYSASKIGADKIVESFYCSSGNSGKLFQAIFRPHMQGVCACLPVYTGDINSRSRLFQSFQCSYNTPVVTVRPFNTFGPRQSARAVIPTIISQALRNCTVHLGNLDARRDLTYVLDTVEGFLKAAEVPGVEGETFNLGSGSEIRIGDLAQKIISLIGKPAKIVVDPARLRPEKSEVQRLLSDNRSAKEKLHWQPRFSLADGLQETIEWVSDHLGSYRTEIYQI